MADAVLVGLDVGTSGVRACAFDLRGGRQAVGAAALHTVRGAAGHVEQDAASWGEAAMQALARLATALGPRARGVAAIGLTGQCPSLTLLDRTGRPATPGLLYADNRAAEQADRLSEVLGAAEVRARSGQWPAAFYAAPKLMWLAAADPALAARQGLMLAQPRDVAGLRLTGRLATDDTHAACTLLFDVHRRAWLDGWAARLGLPWVGLPPVLRPGALLGPLSALAAAATGLPAGTPVIVGGADSLCAALGSGAVVAGVLSDASGSSTCLDLSVDVPVDAAGISLYPHVLPGLWAVDVGMNATGLALRWAAGVLTGGDLDALERLAAAAPAGSEGVAFLPYLADGERTAPGARAGWSGLSLRHGQPHLARGVYEGLTFGLRAALDAPRAVGLIPREVRVSGGGAHSALWSQLKADVFGLPVVAAQEHEAAALGAAMLAGLGAGLYASPEEAVSCCVRLGGVFTPRPAAQRVYDDAFGHWRDAAAGAR